MKPKHGLLRVYLVDDEALALSRLSNLLQATGRINIVGQATDAEIAVRFLSAEPVDVLFLDIQMPGMNGFELLAKLPIQPWVIFTTAHDEYALRAFKVNSIDYLLKPVDPEELDRALDKLEQFKNAGASSHFGNQLQTVLQQLTASLSSAQVQFPVRLPVRVHDSVQFVDLSKVTHFFAKDKLTYAATSTHTFIVESTISELEQKLDPKQFVRIHRSTLVNLHWVDEVHPWFSGRLLIRLKKDKPTEFVVARDRVAAVKDKLGLT
jgi:two-component system LytT family response regulator